ncbi:MAG: hypothetical protein QW620_08440 [Thermoplasmata archaeon]
MHRKRSNGLIRGFYRSKKGAADFYEEIPTVIIAITAITLFFLAATVAYANYQANYVRVDYQAKCNKFLRDIRAWENLTYNNMEGLFDCRKVATYTLDNLTRAFLPDFDFEINVTDTSPYYWKYNRTVKTGNIPNTASLQYGVYVISSGIAIFVNEEEIHEGKLTVTIWR